MLDMFGLTPTLKTLIPTRMDIFEARVPGKEGGSIEIQTIIPAHHQHALAIGL